MSGTNFQNYALRNKNLRNKNFGIDLHRFYMSWIFGWVGVESWVDVRVGGCWGGYGVDSGRGVT